MAGRSTKTNTRSWAKFVALAVAILLPAAPAFAWEYNMKGEYEYRFQYFARTGNNDLFGMASLQENAMPPLAPAGGPFVGFAGPNIWGNNPASLTIGTADTASGANWRITRGGFSTFGSHALINDQRLTLRPTIRVNKAIRVFGVYTVGGLRNKWRPTNPVLGATDTPIPLERYAVFQTSENSYDTMAIGSWEQLRSTFTTPWAIFSIGYKDFPLGTGASTSFATRSTSFLMVVPYGPFRLMGAVWLARSVANASYQTRPDGNEKADAFWGFIGTYDNANLSCGGGTIQRRWHSIAGITGNGRDNDVQFWTIFFKYYNGRFFANSEYTWATSDTTPATNSFGGTFGVPGVTTFPTYVEVYHWFNELGFVMGPLKFSAVYALASGPVQYPETSLGFFNRTKIYGAMPINYQALEPYQWLMFDIYGGGNQEFNGFLMPSDGHGQMGDAYCFAGRIDYAVACNLNIYATYMWAHRLERQGTFFAGYDEAGNDAGFQPGIMDLYGRTNPFVDDGYLGWEAQLGVDWQLLAGMTFRSRYAYWQPGDWFGQAWQGIGMVNGEPSDDTMYRAIDAIHAFQASIVIDF